MRHIPKKALTGSGSAGAVDNEILYENTGLRAYTRHYIHIYGTGSQVCDVDVSLDGTSWATQIPIKNLIGQAFPSQQFDEQIAVIDAKLTGMRVRSKGGTNAVNCSVIHE